MVCPIVSPENPGFECPYDFEDGSLPADFTCEQCDVIQQNEEEAE